MSFNIDFFELMFLAESVIPEKPISRSVCFDDFSDKHYHNMNKKERLQFFEHVKKQYSFSLENEQCRHFYARFNLENQYEIECFHNGKPQDVIAYFYNDEYHTSKNQFINREYVKSIVRVFDRKEFNKYKR